MAAGRGNEFRVAGDESRKTAESANRRRSRRWPLGKRVAVATKKTKRRRARDERAFLFLGKRIGSADLMTPERKESRRGRVRGPDGLAPVRLRALKLLAAVGPVKIPARSPRAARTLDRMGDKE
jgi:hypothetical protein